MRGLPIGCDFTESFTRYLGDLGEEGMDVRGYLKEIEKC